MNTKKNLITEVVDNMDGRGASVRRIDEVDLGALKPLNTESSEDPQEAGKNKEKKVNEG